MLALYLLLFYSLHFFPPVFNIIIGQGLDRVE